jgi:hypothetical protein
MSAKLRPHIRHSFLGSGMDVLQALRDGATSPSEVPSYRLTYFAEHSSVGNIFARMPTGRPRRSSRSTEE